VCRKSVTFCKVILITLLLPAELPHEYIFEQFTEVVADFDHHKLTRLSINGLLVKDSSKVKATEKFSQILPLQELATTAFANVIVFNFFEESADFSLKSSSQLYGRRGKCIT